MATIGLLGAGPVSRGLALLLGRRYRVTIGTRHPELLRIQGLADDIGVASLREAAESDVVVLTVPHRVAPAVVSLVRAQLTGKVLIDTMNAWVRPGAVTEGSWLAARVPSAKVVRAFCHIGHEALVRHGLAEPGRWAAAYAADDETAATVAEELIDATGFVPVRIGGLAQSAPLDVGGVLWPYMFTPEDLRASLVHGAHRPAAGDRSA